MQRDSFFIREPIMALQNNYTILVWKRGEVFYGRIRELGILESASDLPSLWDLIESRRQEIVRRFNEAGIHEEIPGPLSSDLLVRGSASHNVLKKSMSIGSVVIVCLLVLGVTLWFAGKRVVEKIERLSVKHILFQHVQSLSTRLKSFSNEEQEVLHQSLRTIAKEGRPFVEDIKPLLEEIFSDQCSAVQQRQPMPEELSKRNEKSN